MQCASTNSTLQKRTTGQLSKMPQIYFRAQTVLVWLGKKKFEAITEPGWEIVERERDHIRELRMMRTLCKDDYWERVWIVQEIGKASKLQVHFGDEPMEWGTFIGKIRKISSYRDLSGPLRLWQQLEQKHKTGHTIPRVYWRLAKAQSARNLGDKIFMVSLGLAKDGHHLNMDYKKSLI